MTRIQVVGTSARGGARGRAQRRVRDWVVACAAAESVGMTAASAAAVVSDRLGQTDRDRLSVLAVIVAGGLVEGTALGVAQAWLMRPVLGVRARAWSLVTIGVAGLGWAAASAPAALSADDSGTAPALGPVLLGAAGLGVVLGAVLGLAQALTLRGWVAHPWRWVSISSAAWLPTMVVIFAGATAPSAGWQPEQTISLGVVTGLVAGAVLGFVCGALRPALDGPPPPAQALLALLGSRWGAGAGHRLLGLRVHGRRSGRVFELPVQYAVQQVGATDRLVVVPAHPEGKTWWRNLLAEAPLEVLYAGRWCRATGAVLRAGDAGQAAALAAYRRRWPRVRLPDDQLVVVLRPIDAPGWSAARVGDTVGP
ncbi:hypothetical protein [Nocardioides cynanchi]|uniref:hypothetical protein n=1 Tax=Nocardioides cynanchi TaxID=2558918 RepID=UPI0012488E4B|nr:hypothetical protein [Nocardioides cynanchi]